MDNAIKHSNCGESVVMGMRIPRDYFFTMGTGESDLSNYPSSYHLALKDANIEVCNIMTYSSIMPGIATEVPRPEKLVHGSVMESIMAVSHCRKGEFCSAGIIIGWLYDKQDGSRYGGLVCEYHGSLSKEEAESDLNKFLYELYENGFSEDYELREKVLHYNEFSPQKEYGSVVVGICFVSHVIPILK
jgi:arginine decarboxylase